MVDYEGNIIPDENNNRILTLADEKKLRAYKIRCEADPNDPNGDKAPLPSAPPPLPQKQEKVIDMPYLNVDTSDKNFKPTPPPSINETNIVNESDYLCDKSYRVKELYYFGHCRPQNLKEHISSSRVLKLWTLLYPQYNIERLWEYKSYSNYVEYRVTEKATGKVVFEKVTANALLEAVREEYYDYKNY